MRLVHCTDKVSIKFLMLLDSGKSVPPLPVKHYGDYGNLPDDPEVMQRHEMSRSTISSPSKKVTC